MVQKIKSSNLDADVLTGNTELAEAPADTDTFLLHDASTGAIKKIANSNLVGSALITGKDEIAIGNVASDDVILIYDTSAGVLKKITKSAFDALQPAFSSATPSNLLSGDGTGNYTIVIAGTDFDAAATFKLVTDGGTDIAMDTVVIDSSTQLTGVIAKNKANLTNANEPFDIVITNGNGLSTTSANAITIDAQPAWVTSTGSLGTVGDAGRGSASFTIQATDPESGALTINTTLVSGTLPAGSTLVDNGDGTATISGFDAVGSNTTSTFTVGAADANSNFADRQFSITVNAPAIETFNSSGTFSVPSGVTAVNVLVVAGGGAGGTTYTVPQGGGGGGAGGLIYRPAFPVTPGGTVSVTVGNGGSPSPAGSGGPAGTGGTGGSGQDSVFDTLTAKGGGGGANADDVHGVPGGSGGGGSSGGANTPGGSATQPTQPGDSGTYGFGSAGGGSPSGVCAGGGGAGGAGAAGTSTSGPSGGPGGVGKQYSISGTAIYYAGGGGGARKQASGTPGQGGQGGGGTAAESSFGQTGTANRGGGGGATSSGSDVGGSGGKGIVIVQY